ncbi:hypothetical protein CBL_09240 [Carabus blaptoides fortunei]
MDAQHTRTHTEEMRARVLLLQGWWCSQYLFVSTSTHEWNVRRVAQNILTFRSRLALEYSNPFVAITTILLASFWCSSNPAAKPSLCAVMPGAGGLRTTIRGTKPNFQTVPLQSGGAAVAKYSVFQFRIIYERAVDLRLDEKYCAFQEKVYESRRFFFK